MNPSDPATPRSPLKSILRLATGMTFAFLIYQLALNFATGDCSSIQLEVRSKGPSMVALLLGVGTILSFIGIPAALVAATAGMLMGPISGASLSSTAVTLGALLAWILARHTIKNELFPVAIEQRLQGKWYENMMDERTTSGFHWIMSNAIHCPLPFSYFAAITGAKVRHLNPQSLAAGIFISTFFYIAAYALAGSSIGCAAINHAGGFDVSQYKTMVVVSCLLLILLARLQAHTEKRS